MGVLSVPTLPKLLSVNQISLIPNKVEQVGSGSMEKGELFSIIGQSSECQSRWKYSQAYWLSKQMENLWTYLNEFFYIKSGIFWHSLVLLAFSSQSKALTRKMLKVTTASTIMMIRRALTQMKGMRLNLVFFFTAKEKKIFLILRKSTKVPSQAFFLH